MKYLDFYLKVFSRYKIIVYVSLATLVLLEHKIVAYTLYGLALHEVIMLLYEHSLKRHANSLEIKEYDIKCRELAIINKKEDVKLTKIRIKGNK